MTPLDGAGRIDEDGFRRVLARMLRAGIELVVPCGNTGEYSSLTPGEAGRVVEITVDEAAGSASIVAGVGGDCPTATRLAQKAVQAGADGILVHYPRDPYVSDSGLIRYYTSLAEAVEAPVVLYIRGAGLPDAVFDDVLAIPNVIAVKYAVPDVLNLARLVRRYSDTQWVCGLAEASAPFFWLAGARGFTSGLANVSPERSLALLRALEIGEFDTAMAIWTEIAPFEEMRARNSGASNVQVVKEALALAGAISAEVRAPLGRLSEDEVVELAAILEEWGDVVPDEHELRTVAEPR